MTPRTHIALSIHKLLSRKVDKKWPPKPILRIIDNVVEKSLSTGPNKYKVSVN